MNISESGYIADYDENEETIFVDAEYEPLILPVRQYEFFMAKGARGIEAMTLLLHLLYTSRRQHTNQVWAANVYIMKGLDMGERTVIRAKKFLAEYGFISYVRPKDAKTGQFKEKTYLKITYMANPGKRMEARAAEDKPTEAPAPTGDLPTVELAPETAATTIVESHHSGFDRQMLEEATEVLKEASKQESLLKKANEATGLELAEPGFSRVMDKLFQTDARLACLDYITFTYELMKKRGGGGAGLLLNMLADKDKQEAFLDSHIRNKYPEHTCKVCGHVSHSTCAFCPDCGADDTSDVERLRQIFELAGGGEHGCEAIRADLVKDAAPMFDRLTSMFAKATA